MKKTLLFTMLALLSFSCGGGKRTTFNLTVNDSRDTVAYVFLTNVGMPDTLLIKSGNTVSASYDLPGTVSATVRYDQRAISFMAEPGKTYNITADYSDTKNRFVSIDDPAAQAYNKLFSGRNIYKYEFIGSYSAAPLDTVATTMKENFLALMDKDNSALDTVEMSKRLRRAIEKDTELYWMTSLAKVIRANYNRMVRSGTPMYSGYNELWDWIFETYPLSQEGLYSQYLINYADILFDSYHNARHGESDNPHSMTERIYAATEGEMRQELLSRRLYYEVMNNVKTYQKSLVPYLERFIAEYPGTANAAAFAKHIADVEEYHRIAAGAFPEGVRFVEGYGEITTLKDALARFRGTPVFIDFWFTTCRPCLEQFAYNDALKTFLDDNGIEILYISIDPEAQNANWQNSIKKHNLKGYHIRTSHTLHVDLDKNYDVNVFPRYMVVDKEGNIVVEKALYPSEGEKLYTQIKTALGL